MQDAYNLGWKLGSVLEGTARREILSTYTTERHPIAEHLIKLDQEMAEFYSEGPTRDSEEYQSFRDQFSGFLSGVKVQYGEGLLISDEDNCGSCLARHLALGARLPFHKVISQAEANVVRLSDVLISNGKWRILVLPGDIDDPARFEALRQLAPWLEHITKTFNPTQKSSSAVVEVITIHAGQRTDFDLLDLPPVYHPWDDQLGWDYWKVFADNAADYEVVGPVYDQYGVDRGEGCMIVLRPDQHVSCIASLDEAGLVQDHLFKILVPREGSNEAV